MLKTIAVLAAATIGLIVVFAGTARLASPHTLPPDFALRVGLTV